MPTLGQGWWASMPTKSLNWVAMAWWPTENSACFDAAGTQLTPQFIGQAAGARTPTDGLYVVTSTASSAPLLSVDLSMVIDGGLAPIAHFQHGEVGGFSSNFLWNLDLNVRELGGRLLLVTWNGKMTGGLACPACSIDGFYAEYACTP
jgi:hypothetical protein